MKISKVSQSLYDVSMGFVHAYLIKGEDEWALVDTGVPGQGEALLKAMAEQKLEGPIKHIILTQLHSDHAGSVNELKELTGATVYAHEKEADAIEEGLTMRACVPAPGVGKWLMNKILLKGGKASYLKKGTPVDVRLKGGEKLPIGPGVEVLYTPGHTAGHICLILKEEGDILIAGDVASGGKRPGYPMLFEDREMGFATLKELGDRKFAQAYFGHGEGIRSAAAERFRIRFAE